MPTPGYFTALAGIIATQKDATILIASNGGSLDLMETLLVEMKKKQDKGIKFTCVIEHAYSAAFLLMTYCDKRQAYSNSNFMQHRVRTMLFPNMYTEERLKELYEDLVRSNKEWEERNVKQLPGVSRDFIKKAMTEEMYISGAGMEALMPGGWIEIITR